MKKIVKCLVFIGVILSAMFLCGQSWALSLSFNPSSSSIGVGDSIDVDIVISGMENSNLSTFDFKINYVPAVLAFNNYTLGDKLGSISFSEALDLSSGDLGGGVVNLAELSLILPDGSDFSYTSFFSDQLDAFTLATISFTGVDAGTSPLSLSDVILGDEWGYLLPATTKGDSIGVTVPVPEPATMFLLATGLAGMFGFSRKKFS